MAEYLDIEKKSLIGGIFQKKEISLFLQFPIDAEGRYPIYEPFKINVYIIKYPDNKENNCDICLETLPKKKITIQTTDTLNALTKKICEKIGYNHEEMNINIIKKISIFNSIDYYEINKNY